MDQPVTSSSSTSLYSSNISLPTPQISKSKPPSPSTSSAKNRNSTSRQMGTRREKIKVFTPEMQDAQARGKDPFALDGESVDEVDAFEQERYGEVRTWRGNGLYAKETYERRNRMQGGAFAMDNPEVVIWHSLIRQESIPNTRHFFRKMMCGFYDTEDPFVQAINEHNEKEKTEKWRSSEKPLQREWDRQGREWGSGYD